MKDLDIFIIATGKLWSRLESLIKSEELKGENFSVVSKEDAKKLMDYDFTDARKKFWISNVELIKTSLVDNLMRIKNIEYNEDFEHKLNMDFTKPRRLDKGEISVMCKHQEALKRFLMGRSDYALILEDDAIIKKGALKVIKGLINNSFFDYYDIAGGDGINVRNKNLICINGEEGEIIRYQSTRTACAYVVSRASATAIIQEIENLIMPIDWTITVALKKLRPIQEVFWLKNNIISHGSCTGEVKSWRDELWN